MRISLDYLETLTGIPMPPKAVSFFSALLSNIILHSGTFVIFPGISGVVALRATCISCRWRRLIEDDIFADAARLHNHWMQFQLQIFNDDFDRFFVV